MILQQTVHGDMFYGQTFTFAVDTCENMREFTGNEDCKENSAVEEVLNQFVVNTKLSYTFYSTKTYAELGEQLTWTYDIKT